MAVQQLLALDEETWGERVARARGRARLSLKEAAARVSRLVPVSYSSLMRLEYLDAVPTDVKRRMVAYLALIVYGYEPEEFGLSVDDLPRWITAEALHDLRLRGNACFPATAA